jgi:predicted transcriptional regulator
MKIDISNSSLPIFEALASDVRIKIINLLSKKPMNIKELAQELNLSSAIVTMHVNKLEKASIIKGERTRSKGGVQKICTLVVDSMELTFPGSSKEERKYHQFITPIGHYTDFSASPTCGLATFEKQIGYFDDPRCFLDPERVNARILWFSKGFVEYKIPNYILSSQTPTELEISLELCSEAPGYNKNWPSDISFFFNDINLGYWTSPGDFAGERGKYTPSWWSDNINQYGMLKIIRVDNNGTYIDGKKISDTTIKDIDIYKKQWSFKIAVLENAEHVGGLTLFGKDFGNYDQDIVIKLYYN